MVTKTTSAKSHGNRCATTENKLSPFSCLQVDHRLCVISVSAFWSCVFSFLISSPKITVRTFRTVHSLTECRTVFSWRFTTGRVCYIYSHISLELWFVTWELFVFSVCVVIWQDLEQHRAPTQTVFVASERISCKCRESDSHFNGK